MTQNLVAYWNALENKRSNLASEAESKRHNYATEAASAAALAETRRHNYQTELLSGQQLIEQQRASLEQEAQGRTDLGIKQQNADINQQNANTKESEASTKETQTWIQNDQWQKDYSLRTATAKVGAITGFSKAATDAISMVWKAGTTLGAVLAG